MDEKKQIDHPDQAAPLQLPMGQLFYLLYRNGFTVKPDDYIEMLKITERFGSTSIDETAQWICPIIASNDTEQLRFYHVVEEYKKQVAAAAEEPVKRKLVPKRAIAIALVTLLLLVALGMYLSGPKPLELSAEPLKERTVKRGLPVSLDASPLLRGHEQDSANIEFAWQFENKIEKRGLRVAHVFYSPGDFIVKRTFSSTKRRLARDADSLLVHVCNDLPQVSINLPPEAVNIDEPVNLTAAVVADTGTVSFYQWTVRDSVFTTQMPEASNIVFTATGDYPVSCKAVVGAVEAPCSVTDTKIITVQNKGRRFVANVSAGGITYAAGKPGLKWWVTLALLLPAGAAVMYSLFKRKPKPAAKETAGKKTISSSAGPFDVPFEQNDTALIQPEKELRRGFTQMKFKAEEEQLVLSVGGTINSIIRSGGSPQLVYAPQIKPQQYMLLIDRSNPKSMLTQLFTWLSRAMEEEGIPVTTFFYDDRFTCYNENYPAGTALQKLAETYNAATLIILGKCHQFIYPIYPQIEEQYLKTLQQWQNKVIITPLPLQDWNAKERILQQYLLLLPADAVFFQKLIPLLREKSRPRNEVLALEATAQGILKEYDARSISNLRQYLGNNEVLFQWLCAICVYPRLRWEVLVEVGEAILTKYGQPSLLNYNNLLLLARIPWMQQGVFPQLTRLELLKELSIENELCARERVLKMLQYASTLHGENDAFFQSEKQRQQLTNQFILHASNQQQYNQYAGSRDAFKKLWKNDAILDMPLKKYLDKTAGDNWQTPVNDGNGSVGLAAYFNLHELTVNKSIRNRKILAGLFALGLFLLWVFLAFGGGAARLSPWLPLAELPRNTQVPVTIKMLKNFKECGDTNSGGFKDLSGFIQIGNEQWPLQYNAVNSVASFSIPDQQLAGGSARLQLSWDDNQGVITPLNIQARTVPDTVTIVCVDKKRSTKALLYVRYNDESGYRAIAPTLDAALYQYNASALQTAFNNPSRIVYYEPEQKGEIDTLTRLLKEQLQLDVKAEYVPEKRTPPARPILFINTSSDSTTGTTNPDNSLATADDLHRMGDQYMSENQYLKAINEYSAALKINEKDDLAYYQRGLAYEMLGSTSYAQKAMADYDAAIRLNNTHVLYYYRRASVKYFLKRYADAITDYNKVITMHAPEAGTQYNYAMYYRGRCYYYLNNLASACKDFKRSGELGIAAGKKDFASYCAVPAGPDCNRTFYSLREAISAGAGVVCKLDLSKENISTLPKELYSFVNLSELNLGATAIAPSAIAELQKALPKCTINYSAAAVTETDLGDIELDNTGYTNAAGQQVMQNVSRLLKAQPRGRIRLSAYYTTDEESKTITGYVNTIVNMFEKIGVNAKTQISRQIIKRPAQVQQQQQQQKAPDRPNFVIHVTGINLQDKQLKTSY